MRQKRFMNSHEVRALRSGTIATATLYPTSSLVDASNQERMVFVIHVVTSDVTTAQFKLRQATDASGTGVKDVAFTDANNVTYTAQSTAQSGATLTGKTVVLELDPDQLDFNNGFRYVGVVATLTGGTGTTGLIALVSHEPFKQPITQGSTVQEVVHFDSSVGAP